MAIFFAKTTTNLIFSIAGRVMGEGGCGDEVGGVRGGVGWGVVRRWGR